MAKAKVTFKVKPIRVQVETRRVGNNVQVRTTTSSGGTTKTTTKTVHVR